MTILAGVIFFEFPQMDLYVSALFFKNGHFYLARTPFIKFIYRYSPLLVLLPGIFAILSAIYMTIKKVDLLFGFRKKIYIFMVLAILVGPALMVNLVLKENFGRARPKYIVEFGGNKEFTKPFIISNQCETNCSFVSGHSSIGFYFCALAPIFSGRKKKIVFGGGILLGSVIGLIRIIGGAHFASDVYFSFVAVYLPALLLHYWMFSDEYKQIKQLSDR